MATEKRLIDPDELRHMIEILYQEHYVKSYDKTVHDIFNAVRRRINRCSTVYAAPVVHGQWIPCENGGYHCSVCDKRFGFVFDNHYCPNCGADMRERKDNG